MACKSVSSHPAIHHPTYESRHKNENSYPEVSLKHDDLYARAWECEYEQPISDAENNNSTPPSSLEIPVQSDSSTEEMRNTPGTPQERSLQIFPQTEQLWDVTDRYPYRQPHVETSSEQPNNSPTNPPQFQVQLTSQPET